MAIKRDCFGYKFNGYCFALTKMECIKGDCPFYKTKKQFADDALKAKAKNEKRWVK